MAFKKAEIKKGQKAEQVEATFQTSGVPYGYAYTAGQTGLIRKEDAETLVKNRVVINPRPVVEKATAKTVTEKATA